MHHNRHKKSVIMRKSDDPNYEIDWVEFASVDRQKLQVVYYSMSS